MTPEPCTPISGDAGSTLMSSRPGLNSPSLAVCSLSLAGSGLILLGLVTAQENQSAAVRGLRDRQITSWTVKKQ